MFKTFRLLRPFVNNIPRILSNNNNLKYYHQPSTFPTNFNNDFPIKKEINLPSLIYSPKIEPLPFLGIFEKIPNIISYKEPKEEISKQAARLIVIRKRKMRKHKLKKLRIKMKFEWAKVRQKREMRKEKAFQEEMIAQMREGEKFDAATFVREKLNLAYQEPENPNSTLFSKSKR